MATRLLWSELLLLLVVATVQKMRFTEETLSTVAWQTRLNLINTKLLKQKSAFKLLNFKHALLSKT